MLDIVVFSFFAFICWDFYFYGFCLYSNTTDIISDADNIEKLHLKTLISASASINTAHSKVTDFSQITSILSYGKSNLLLGLFFK